MISVVPRGENLGKFAVWFSTHRQSDQPVYVLNEWAVELRRDALVRGLLAEWPSNLNDVAEWLCDVFPASRDSVVTFSQEMTRAWHMERSRLIERSRGLVDAWYVERIARLDYLVQLQLDLYDHARQEMIDLLSAVEGVQAEENMLREECQGKELSDEEWEIARGTNLNLDHYRDTLDGAQERVELRDALRGLAG